MVLRVYFLLRVAYLHKCNQTVINWGNARRSRCRLTDQIYLLESTIVLVHIENTLTIISLDSTNVCSQWERWHHLSVRLTQILFLYIIAESHFSENETTISTLKSHFAIFLAFVDTFGGKVTTRTRTHQMTKGGCKPVTSTIDKLYSE